MSTRIYNAFRVKDSEQVWRVLADIRERGQAEVVKRLRDWYRSYVENVDPDSDEYREARQSDPHSSEFILRIFMAQKVIRKGFRDAVASANRDLFDPDVNIGVTWHETGFYLRAFCDRVSLLGGSLDFLERHPDLEDFHYQNQADPPDDIPEDVYEARGRIWDEMMVPRGEGVFRNQLVLEISSWSCFWYLDPFLQLCREYRDNPTPLPGREVVSARRLYELDAFAAVSGMDGSIVGTRKDGASVAIERRGNQWESRVDATIYVHANLNAAVNWVEYLHLPDYLRRWADEAAPGAAESNVISQKAVT